MNRDQKAFLKNKTFHGNEIVARTRRLCLMNLFLHNIGEIDGNSLIASTDALIAQPSHTVDYVLANPPFGSMTSTSSLPATTPPIDTPAPKRGTPRPTRRALAQIHACRTDRARQNQSRSLLAQRRQPRRPRQSPPSPTFSPTRSSKTSKLAW